MNCGTADHFIAKCKEELSTTLKMHPKSSIILKQKSRRRKKQIEQKRIGLYSAAEASIVHPASYSNVQGTHKTINIQGLAGLQLEVRKEGALLNTFRCFVSRRTEVTILCLADAADLDYLILNKVQGFFLQLLDRKNADSI